MRIALYVFILISITIYSCKKKVLTPDEMEVYVLDKKNGLLIEKEDNGIKVQAVYRPSELVAWQEIKSKEMPDKAYIDSVNNRYKQNLYFVLNLSKQNEDILNEAPGTAKFSHDLGVVAFGMNEYIKLISSSKDTIPLLSYMYPRMYGMSSSTSLLLAFRYDKAKANEWIEIVVDDAELGIGRKKLRFKCSDLYDLPELKFDNENN